MQNLKFKNDISERLLNFGVNILELTAKLKTPVGYHVGRQLMRSGTSAGANYEEVCGAESLADFIHKLQVVLKELKESLYWLRLIKKATLLPGVDQNLSAVMQESNELINIIAKSVVTAKNKKFNAK